MRSYKVYAALIGFALILQACRGAGLQTLVPVATETVIATQPPLIEGERHAGCAGGVFCECSD